MGQDVFNAARAVGCTDYFAWEIAPDHFASLLLTAAKRYARFLKECRLVKSHSEALEMIAKAASFPHWHAFHAVVQGLFDVSDDDVHWPWPAGSREPIKSLIPAFVFMVQASPDCPPTPEEMTGLTKAATQLARACNCSVEQMLDVIGKMNGADTWEDLLHRRPEHSKGPLYGFHVDEDGSGRFVISSACSALIEQQDRLFQGLQSRTESQQKEFEDQLAVVLEARPDFLEGLLAKAEILRHKPRRSADRGKAYNEAITRANEFLPAGFKGKISWYDLPNRFYHRLLYGAMVWHSHAGHTAKAVSLARRQLRLNESDNLGVRMWLPVLLVANGQAEAADKAVKKMIVDEDDTDAGVELVKAICHYANGRYQQSAEALYLSVFLYPPMRHVICFDWDLLVDAVNDKNSTRTISPDPNTMVDQYLSAAMQLDGLEQALDRWLGHPAVAAAEATLAREFHANWRQPNGSLKKWDVEVKAQAALLPKGAVFAKSHSWGRR